MSGQQLVWCLGNNFTAAVWLGRFMNERKHF
jgi:hypothetical protein